MAGNSLFNSNLYNHASIIINNMIVIEHYFHKLESLEEFPTYKTNNDASFIDSSMFDLFCNFVFAVHNMGGLNLFKMELFKKTLLVKQIWRVISNTKSLLG